jgi:hypothetical protein
MGCVKEAHLYHSGGCDDIWEPTDDELEAMASEHFASISPKPIPCDPSEEYPTLTAWDLFVPRLIEGVIQRNRDWMQWTNRTTSEVLSALFINVNYAGMTDIEAMRRISPIIHDAGYSPSNQSPNPTWTFPV